MVNLVHVVVQGSVCLGLLSENKCSTVSMQQLPRRVGQQVPGRMNDSFSNYLASDSIHRFIFISNTAPGNDPSSNSSSWNLRMSNFGPRFFSASSRISRIFSWPIL